KPVKEPFRFTICELQSPRPSAIRSLVDSRFLTLAGAQDVSCVRVNAVYITKIQFFAARDDGSLPVRASIKCSDEGTVAPAGPDDVLIHSTQAAQSSFGSTLLILPAGQTRIRLFHCRGHLMHHLRYGKALPTMAAALTVGDSRIGGRLGFPEKVVEQVN